MDSLLSPPELPPQYRIVSAASHPQILEKWWPIRTTVYPEWFIGTWKYEVPLVEKPALTPFHLFVVVGVEDVSSLHPSAKERWDSAKVVAKCSSIPFYWAPLADSTMSVEDALQSLPDGGWDDLLELGLSQASDVPADPPAQPNALGGLEVFVLPEYRKDNLADILIRRMKALAKINDIKVVAIPVRPTLKHQYPKVPMQEYIQWRQEPTDSSSLPFDPWLRKHCRLGAKIVKVCPGTIPLHEMELDEWSSRAGVDARKQIQDRANPDGTDKLLGDFFEFEVPFALTPVKFYPKSNKGVLMEPNVWLYHMVD